MFSIGALASCFPEIAKPNSCMRCAGGLLALAALQQGSAAAVMCLRTVNPYVAAALGDWKRRGGTAPSVPRTFGPGPQLKRDGALAGASHKLHSSKS